MNNKSCLILIVIIAFSCKPEKTNIKSDLELANLKGKVLKIEKTIHDANAGSACPAAEKITCNQSIYEYNDKGNLVESFDVDLSGNIAVNCKYIYTKHNECTEVQKYSGDKLIGKEINIIDGSKLTEIKSFDEFGVNDKIYKYEYSEDQLTDEKILNSAGEMESSVHNEYVNGQLDTQTKTDAFGNISSIVKYTRNNQNDIVEYSINVPQANMVYKFIFEYEYDDQGNWIKQTQYYNGMIETITIRTITYANT